MASASLCIAIIVIAASLIGYTVTADGDYTYTSLVLRICNGETYPFWSNNFDSPGLITEIIAQDIPVNPNFDVYNSIVKTPYILYGHGSCSRRLDKDQCATCMDSARVQLFSECSWHSVGAQIELRGCKLRYENYNFGQPT